MTDTPNFPLADFSNLAATWWQALTLAERNEGIAGMSDPELAQQRMLAWRKQTAYLDDSTFAARLEAEGLSVEHLVALLGESPEALHTRQTESPPWLVDLFAAYARTAGAKSAVQPGAGFLVAVLPLIDWACAQLSNRLDALLPPRLFHTQTIESSLHDALTQQLPPLIERTFVLELHVARMQELLTGATPEERFDSFLTRLSDPAISFAILAEYPVLARQLVTKAKQTTTAIAEVVERLTRDFAEIQRLFAHDQPLGMLDSVEIGAGDTHRDGRSVAILRFTNGAKLVYKPRILAVDLHFQHLLSWLNERGAEPPLRTLNVLDRTEYGWVEFVSPALCTTAEQVKRFYQRQGSYLALLYILRAADFHFENLLAVGEHPVLIDLEALFHPDVMAYDLNHPGQLAQSAMDQSVLSIGMLPQRMRFHADAAVVDISGIGAEGRQMTPDKLPVWQGVGTDEMRLVRQHVEFSSSGHRPELAGQSIDVSAHSGAVAQGFEQLYRLLLRERSALSAPDGPLARFAEAEIRVVARPTRTYALLLQESSHPDLLRSALDRDRLYSRLWRDVGEVPQFARLLASERRDMHNGDVPIFHAKPAHPHLWDSRGEMIPDYLAETGLQRVHDQIQAMSEDDLTRQLWYIHSSFATLSGTNLHAATPQRESTTGKLSLGSTTPTTDTWLATACAIGDQLIEQAHRHDDKAIWIGLGLDEQNTWSLSPLTMHLYDGHAGLALFFAYLGDASGDQRYTRMAQAALTTTILQAESMAATFPYVGGFSGWGGLIYTLAHLGQLWERPDLWARAGGWADRALSHVDEDDRLDVIGGAAGCIGGVDALYRCTGDPRFLTLMARCAEHLVAMAQPVADGIGWVVPHMGGLPLAGFSHGASGFAWALLLAAEQCNNPSYRIAAQSALVYERTLFDAKAGNWRDLRSEDGNVVRLDDAPALMYAWCHGAPGIGLARLSMLTRLDDPLLRSEIDVALASTATKGMNGGHSLCHGDWGNIDLFISAGEVLADSAYLAQARALATRVLAQQAHTGWVCGVPGGIETPGLMVGLAGIGYEMLRLADPSRIPSILLMEAPRRS